MSATNTILAVALCLPLAFGATLQGPSGSSHPQLTLAVAHKSVEAISEMEAVFVRSEERHHQSMDEISKRLTLTGAAEVVRNSTLANASSLKQIIGLLSGSQRLRAQNAHGSDGFGGLDGARKLLNEMIHESMLKYDEEIAKCTDFYAKQCALMEVARGQISAANFVAASSRALILDAQGNIDKTQKSIPEQKQELKEHNQKCKAQLKLMNKNLKALMGDIAVMTMILKMSDCDAKKLLQTEQLAMLRCEDECTKKEFVTFNHSDLQQQVSSLSSPLSQNSMAAAFSDLFDDGESVDASEVTDFADSDASSASFIEVSSNASAPKCKAVVYQHGDFKGWKATFSTGVYPFKQFKGKGAKNDDASSIKVFGRGCKAVLYQHGDFKGWKAEFTTGEYPFEQFKAHLAKNDDASAIKVMELSTKPKKKIGFNNPPVPKTKVPGNPCTDPNKGAPGAAVKRAAKCTLKKSPQCYKLQGRFLQIQAEIADQRDELMDQISKQEDACADMRKSLESGIANDNALLSTSQTKLAAASEKEASAGEQGRQVAKENTQYNNDLVKMMKSCNTHYVDYETELCALRKIRGDLFKKMKPGHPGFFQDCEVSKWTPEACTKKCAGGEQKLTRNVMTHPSGGTKCLPLSARKKCNRGPCPVNCVLATWGGWSKCSAKCGGGIQQRVRDVKVPMRYGGKPCSSNSETKACNVAACSKDCVLTPWTKWTKCSKDCDGGSRKRQRFVKEPAEGSGKCPGQWSVDRLQYKACNAHRCKVRNPAKVMKCDRSLDVVLLLDGTPKSGKNGWNAEVEAAKSLVDAFTGKAITAKPNFAVIHYTGPRTWSGVSKCTGKSTKKVDIAKDCKVKIASHFEEDTKKVKAVIGGLQFQPGAKLLSLGLMSAISEMPLGRKTKQTIVVVFMDGHPLSYRKTLLASRQIRKKARLVYVVVSKFSPLKAIRSWASRRWQENIVVAADHRELAQPETGTHIIANICPKKTPVLELGKMPKGMSLD